MTIPSTPVFKDPALDKIFRRDGYVITPLLGAAEVRELLELHEKSGLFGWLSRRGR